VRAVELVFPVVVAEPREQPAGGTLLDLLLRVADRGDAAAGERVDDLRGVDDALGDLLALLDLAGAEEDPNRRTISSLISS